MKKIILAVLFLVWSIPAHADISGMPTVVAGDIMIVNGVRIHLHGIDAPEPNQVCVAKGRNYRCGTVAMTALMDLVAGTTVTCRLHDDSVASFTYATCQAGGFDLSSNMVHTGWALADRKSTHKYIAVEGRAKKAKRGLWRGKFAKPWDWRGR
jgi:endonuclease YncB( thermonuclease family)